VDEAGEEGICGDVCQEVSSFLADYDRHPRTNNQGKEAQHTIAAAFRGTACEIATLQLARPERS
jgi:hypothetical protein